MPHEVRTVSSAWPQGRALAYMADFSNAAKWDPGVACASRVDDGDVRVGSAFDLDVRSGRSTRTFRYVVTSLTDSSVTLRAVSGTFISEDTITVQAAPDQGSTVRYDAGLALTGWARAASPLLAIAFRRLVDRAAASLAVILAIEP